MAEQSEYYVYIMSNRSSTLYIGMTDDLLKRVWQHKAKLVDSFTKRYSINRLVYYETGGNLEAAANREHQLKGWKRDKKIALIESVNPEWKDLSLDLMDSETTQTKPVIKRGKSVLSRHGDSSLHSESI